MWEFSEWYIILWSDLVYGTLTTTSSDLGGIPSVDDCSISYNVGYKLAVF